MISELPVAYYLALRQTQRTIPTAAPDWQHWLEFFLHSLTESVRRLTLKIERDNIVLATLPASSLLIVEFTRTHGRITMRDAVRLTGVRRNTLEQHFSNAGRTKSFARAGPWTCGVVRVGVIGLTT